CDAQAPLLSIAGQYRAQADSLIAGKIEHVPVNDLEARGEAVGQNNWILKMGRIVASIQLTLAGQDHIQHLVELQARMLEINILALLIDEPPGDGEIAVELTWRLEWDAAQHQSDGHRVCPCVAQADVAGCQLRHRYKLAHKLTLGVSLCGERSFDRQ